MRKLLRYVTISAAFLCLLVSPSQASEEGIKGKAVVTPGRKVILELGHLNAVSRTWELLNPPADGDEGEVNLPFVTPDGSTLVFVTTVPGKYYFAAAVLLPGEGDGKPTQKLLKHVLTVGDSDDPTPTPLKPLPDGKFGLAKLTQAKCGASKIPPSLAKKSALVYRSAAGRIVDASIKTPEDAYSAVKVGLEEALTDMEIEVFDKGVLEGLANKLDELATAKKLTTVGELSVAFSEIALGLENSP